MSLPFYLDETERKIEPPSFDIPYLQAGEVLLTVDVEQDLCYRYSSTTVMVSNLAKTTIQLAVKLFLSYACIKKA